MTQTSSSPGRRTGRPCGSRTDPAKLEAARVAAGEPTAAEAAEALRILERDIARQARAPFRRMLRDLIGAAPTPEAIRAFADRYPDRWAQAVSIAAGLAGYVRDVVEVNVFNVQSLSDAQLMARLVELDRQLGASRGVLPRGEVVEAEVLGAPEGSPPPPSAGAARP